MLSNLYKYETRYYAKTSWPIFLALLVATGMAIVSIHIPTDVYPLLTIVKTLMFTPYPLVIIAMLIMPLVLIVVRFYRHLFSHQGYLSFTLPVEPMDHFYCKFVCSLVMYIVICIPTFLSLLSILYLSIEDFSLFAILHMVLGEAPTSIIVTGIISIVSQGVAGLLTLYTAVCVGQLAKNKILGAIGGYFAINYGLQIVNSVIFIPFSIFFIPMAESFEDVLTQMSFMLGMFAFLYAVESVLMVFVCRHMITKKLNLE